MSNDVKFREACETGNTVAVTQFVQLVQDINKPNSKGWNAIILAAFNHHLAIVKLLLQHGADINSTNANGTTVFMYAKTKVLTNGNFHFLDYYNQLFKGTSIQTPAVSSNSKHVFHLYVIVMEYIVDSIKELNP